MRFVSFSSKKKLRQKDSNLERRAFGPPARETHQNFPFFFLVNLRTFGRFFLEFFQAADMGSRRNHPDFFLFKKPSHLATSPC
jgi:hypothetical protein